MSGFVAAFANINGFWYNLVFFFMIIVVYLFLYSYYDQSKPDGGRYEEERRIYPGVKPGRKTAEFIDNVMSKITLPGSIFLGFVAIMPALGSTVRCEPQFAQFYGGTSLLILVGVVLDTFNRLKATC